MAKSDKEIEYILSLRDEATKVFNTFTSSVEKNSISIGGMAKTAGAAIGAMFTIDKAMDFMQKAADAEAVTAQLENAVRHAADARTGDIEALIAQSQALKNKVAIDDEEIQRVQTLLIGMTGSVKTSEQLTMAVLDLSKGMGISTEAASKMFGKSVEGQNALGKLGITIKETSDDAKRMAEIAAEVEKKWGGAAEAFRNTDAGKIQATKLAIDDLEKSVGKLLNKTFLPSMPGIVAVLDAIGWVVEKLIGGLRVGVAVYMTAIVTPLAAMENMLNNIGVTNSHVMQNFMQTGARLTEEYAKQLMQTADASKKSSSEIVKDTTTTTVATKNLNEQIDELQKTLKTLDPNSPAWMNAQIQVIKLQGQLDVLVEHAKLAAKGLQGLTPGDTSFILHLKPKIDPLNTESFSSDTQKSIGDKFFITPSLKLNRFNDSLSQMMSESEQWFKEFNQESSKMFGGDISSEDIAKVEEQMSLINDLRLKSIGGGKAAEIALIDEWEQKAVEMAHGREDLITQIHDTAEQERSQTSQKYALEIFQSIAGFATQAADLYAQSVSQSAQAIIQTIEQEQAKEIAAIDKRNKKELQGYDTEKKKIQQKYETLLENEQLTAEQKKALRKKEDEEIAANEKAKALAEEKMAEAKQAKEDEYNRLIRQEKTRAFQAQKQAQVIASVINTAVEVTKVLATPWMIPIVAGLGLAQTAIIESQPTPKFHTGGSGYFDASPTQEAYVKIRGQEKIDVYTPEQMASQKNTQTIIYVTNHFNMPVKDEEFVRNAILKTLKSTGLPIEESFADKSNSVVLKN